jgi:hypothetical protein
MKRAQATINGTKTRSGKDFPNRDNSSMADQHNGKLGANKQTISWTFPTDLLWPPLVSATLVAPAQVVTFLT